MLPLLELVLPLLLVLPVLLLLGVVVVALLPPAPVPPGLAVPDEHACVSAKAQPTV